MAKKDSRQRKLHNAEAGEIKSEVKAGKKERVTEAKAVEDVKAEKDKKSRKTKKSKDEEPAETAEITAGEPEEESVEDEAAKKDRRKKERKKRRKLIRSVLGWIEWFTFLAVVGFCAFTFIQTSRGKAVRLKGYSLLNIVTGSMEPTILKDEYVIVKKTDVSELGYGDIVAYYSEAKDVKGKLVIHRIVEVCEDGTFILKGDANTAEDALPVRGDQILGKYVRKARFFNWLSSFMNPKKLVLLLVIIPLVLVCFYETASLAKLVHKASKEKKEAGGPQETREEKIERLRREAVEAFLAEQGGVTAAKKNDGADGASDGTIDRTDGTDTSSGERTDGEKVREETEEEKIARWKREGVEEYLAKQAAAKSGNRSVEKKEKSKETGGGSPDSVHDKFRKMRVRHAKAVRNHTHHKEANGKKSIEKSKKDRGDRS